MKYPMLYFHWRQARLALLPFVVGAFSLPLLANRVEGREIAEAAELAAPWLPVFPAFAVAIGFVLALIVWNSDHQQNHVYALALPLPRWEYALRKMGAGMAVALVPVAAFWVGAQIATARATLPEGMNAYPNLLTLRFLFAVVLAYAVLFAMASGTIRTTLWTMTGLVLLLAVGGLLNEALAQFIPVLEEQNLIEILGSALLTDWGPLGVLTGNWRLIDV